MKLTLTWSSLLAFVALLFFLGEAHELVHTGLGRLLCGGWGQRDFNVWTLCDTCAVGRPWNLAATFAGPIFTFAVGWWGYFLLDSRNHASKQAVGFALVFATLPFARILGALMGGNDEVYALSKLLPYAVAWPLGAVLVLLATVPPLVRAYTVLLSPRRIWMWLAFFLLPTVVVFVVVLGALNSLLASGFLATYWILGSPILVTAWTLTVTLVLGLTYRHLFELGQPVVVAR
ncbi:hypothetical protein MTX78_00680 [Hymenobacter tibetensis]|uniref:DUF3995 domain-containing protein n=1 Tax=Hymenobacter tibetensis TaxID=497967 RepID=A0ABY4CYJ3_9BACT|nr:hypothetical protein [Hymenobacter tibetensis]UOG75127.1 hypothetical protein MTX78_00680 [Hymenobacter tibetensis]